MSQWVYSRSKFKSFVDIVQPSFKKQVLVVSVKPEAKWSNLEQVEKNVAILFEGPNQFVLQYIWMTWD